MGFPLHGIFPRCRLGQFIFQLTYVGPAVVRQVIVVVDVFICVAFHNQNVYMDTSPC